MATSSKPDPSTATKIAVGAGAVAIVGGLLGLFGGGKKAAPKAKPVGGCGRCGR